MANLLPALNRDKIKDNPDLEDDEAQKERAKSLRAAQQGLQGTLLSRKPGSTSGGSTPLAPAEGGVTSNNSAQRTALG